MAVNSQSRGLASFGKRFFGQISHSQSSFLAARRAVHLSVYEKNVDDQLRGTVVPDDVIGQHSEKYWGPHPQTGVFGPSSELKPSVSGHASAANGGSENSALEQKAFFRPLENLEKPVEDPAKLHQL